ncbi:hypothetical protein GYMLUDRAFT_86706 [Collybiopsis luxurians FD-317 M1]|uniref:Cyclin-D1-binding protein 1-like N-terminal domain-containing protein n=1 Tax=Collybiopsis luxurians FD-317 M1 TaxID=944289 RepID=A0A0D0BRJ8_9AGAR|nr:hypothetical protein GYMLUDRAFT_86706 [Collybiopsis luxurians FD-317 M1]
MTDQQKAIEAIESLVQTCKSVKASISNHPKFLDDPPALPVLYKDLISLLSLIYGSVTKLSLALKPSSPTYSACLLPIKDISDRIAALSHCVNMFNASVHGATLIKETLSIVTEVVDAVEALATTFLEIERSDLRSNRDYLVRTGAIHNIIETARSSEGLAKDNSTAIRRLWQKDAGTLEDGIREVGEMIQDAQSETDPDEEGGWDELGIGPSKPFTEDELNRTKKVVCVKKILPCYLIFLQVLTVLRLCNLLHKKIISDILSAPSPSLLNTALDKLAPLSPALLGASDELISTLDSPQDVESIATELNALKTVIDDIRTRLSSLKTDSGSNALLSLETDSDNALTVSLERISLTEKAAVPTNLNPREKWFNNCFAQIAKAIQSAA